MFKYSSFKWNLQVKSYIYNSIFQSEKVIFNCLNSLPKDFKKIVIENSHDEVLKKLNRIMII